MAVKIDSSIRVYESLGEPVQLLILDKETTSYNLNSKVVQDILNQEDVKDCNIAVISCAGAFRQGKSFLLSFFIRYLNEMHKKNSDSWLGNRNFTLSGFAWRGGCDRETTGIWIWSKIFPIQLSEEERIGVMLMDTQGTFDNESTMNDNVTIFSLSTMLSSLQIYNLFDNIKEDDLNNLQLFTAYGKLAIETTKNVPFQQLLFLIRDWRFKNDFPYGFDGGKKKLEQVLKTKENQAKELYDVRKNLKKCFENLSACLLPNPGKAAMDENFKISELDKEFIEELEKLVLKVLAPKNLSVKKINGEKIKVKDFYRYIDSYWAVFNNDEMPSPTTILNATALAVTLAVVDEATQHYKAIMDPTMKNNDVLPVAELISVHEEALEQSIKIFKDKAVLGDPMMLDAKLEKLKYDLVQTFTLYVLGNVAKESSGLKKTIDILLNQVEDFEAKNDKQATLIKIIKERAESYEKRSQNEIQSLIKKVKDLTGKRKCTIS